MYKFFMLKTSQLFEKIDMHISETNRLFVSKKTLHAKKILKE